MAGDVDTDPSADVVAEWIDRDPDELCSPFSSLNHRLSPIMRYMNGRDGERLPSGFPTVVDLAILDRLYERTGYHPGKLDWEAWDAIADPDLIPLNAAEYRAIQRAGQRWMLLARTYGEYPLRRRHRAEIKELQRMVAHPNFDEMISKHEADTDEETIEKQKKGKKKGNIRPKASLKKSSMPNIVGVTKAGVTERVSEAANKSLGWLLITIRLISFLAVAYAMIKEFLTQ